jgi:signal transduction histidine kinase
MQTLIDARLAMQAELVDWKEKAEQLARSEESLQNQLAQAHATLASQSSTAPSPSHGQPGRGLNPRGILISDEQGHIIIANQGARRLLSHTPLEGAPLQSLFAEPAWIEAVNRLSHEGSRNNDATAIIDLDGEVMRAELTRIPDITGGVGTLAVMFYPEEQITYQSDALIALTHELRTPMTSITGYTDLLLGESVGILGATQRQLLQRINANIERMGGLLEDMVKTTSLDAAQVSLSPEPVDLINVIEDAIMSLSSQFSEYKVGVQMDMPSELPSITADRDSLYQIVLHLLSNACRCSKPDTEVLIRARLEEYDSQIDNLPDYLFMAVADTGGGIAPEDQRRVFQRLYRADNPTIEGLGDTGVGLSIAKALVETQGGRIWAESEMGAGTTFSFVLPLSQNEGHLPPGPFPRAETGPGGEQ